MGIKQFFNKAGQGLKKVFSKGGTLDSTFKKGGIIDTGLNMAGQIAGKVANVASSLAPVVSAVNPELGLGLAGVSQLAKKAGDITGKIQSAKNTAVSAYNKPLNQPAPSIMAPKPQPQDDGIGLNGMAGLNFA